MQSNRVLNEQIARRMGPHFLFLFQQLEQEKHRLRLQIEVMEDEYEQRIADLRSDLAAMKTRDSIQQNPWHPSLQCIPF